MGFFDRMRGPVFLKDDSDAERQLAQLEALLETADADTAKDIRQEIMLVQAGIAGEKQVRYELENSHIPMFVLHDLYLEHDGLSAQIDYLIVTHKHQFVIECKNLYGNIEINSSGDFIRNFSYGKFWKKEGIYSPVTQNRRHMELIKQIRALERPLLFRKAFEKNFYRKYRSVVVLANPKTVLYAKHAKEDVRDQVIRADQLAEYIRKTDAEPGSDFCSEKEMEELARFFLDIHKQNPVDYTEKYRSMLSAPESAQVEPKETMVIPPEPQEVTPPVPEQPAPQPEPQTSSDEPAGDTILCPRCGAPMVKRKAAKGKNAGRFFYGCSRYPKCRGIVNIDADPQSADA